MSRKVAIMSITFARSITQYMFMVAYAVYIFTNDQFDDKFRIMHVIFLSIVLLMFASRLKNNVMMIGYSVDHCLDRTNPNQIEIFKISETTMVQLMIFAGLSAMIVWIAVKGHDTEIIAIYTGLDIAAFLTEWTFRYPVDAIYKLRYSPTHPSRERISSDEPAHSE